MHNYSLRLTHVNVYGSQWGIYLIKPCSCMQFILKNRIFYCKLCKNPYQYYKSHENPYQVLQVMRAASECAMKSKVHMIISPLLYCCSLVPTPRAPPGEKRSGERSRISWAYSPKRWKTNEIARSLIIT